MIRAKGRDHMKGRERKRYRESELERKRLKKMKKNEK